VTQTRNDGASSAALLSAAQVVIQALVLFATYRVAVLNVGLAALGLWSVASAASTFGRIGDMGFSGAVPRLLAERLGGLRQSSIGALIQTATLSSAIGTVLLSAMLFVPLLLFTQNIAAEEHKGLARNLVIGANISLIASALSLTFQSCLDGLGRFRERVIVSSIGSVLNLLVVWISIESLGAMALPAGAIAQGFFLLIAFWVVLRAQVPGILPRFPTTWSNTEFRELFAFGKFTQANSLLGMMFEPTSRVLAGQFGSVEFAALFDLAAKVTGNVRLVFSSASQALVPFFAFAKSDRERSAVLFVASTSLVAVSASVMTAITAAFSPLLSLFALNELNGDFLAMFWILLLGNLVNVVGGPAFFFAMGAGEVKFSTAALAIQAGIFCSAAIAFHVLTVRAGVPIAYAMAVAGSGAYVLMHGIACLTLDRMRLQSTFIATLMPPIFVLTMGVVLAKFLDADKTLALVIGVVLTTVFIAVHGVWVHRASFQQWRKEITMFKVSVASSV